MSIIRLLGTLRVIVTFIVPFAVLLEGSGKPGPKKRSEVVTLLKERMAELGLELPSWLGRFSDPLLETFVDVVVALLNRSGFFEHGEQLTET